MDKKKEKAMNKGALESVSLFLFFIFLGGGGDPRVNVLFPQPSRNASHPQCLPVPHSLCFMPPVSHHLSAPLSLCHSHPRLGCWSVSL